MLNSIPSQTEGLLLSDKLLGDARARRGKNYTILSMAPCFHSCYKSCVPSRDVSCNERNITRWSHLTKNGKRNYFMRFLMNMATTPFLSSESVRRRTQI